MRVTQVTELSKSRSKVYIDQEFAFVLYKGELRLYHIKEGQQLSEEDYRTIMQEVLPKRAKLRAMNLLQGREYTTAQLRTKLQQGFYPAEIIEQAFIISMICDMPWIILLITRTAAAGGGLNRICRARESRQLPWKRPGRSGGRRAESRTNRV
jgi:hypothetical protein